MAKTARSRGRGLAARVSPRMACGGAALAVLVLASTAARAAGAARVSIFAAASLTDVLTAIGRDFHAATGQAVEFNFAASSALVLQIQEGARADLFFSADDAKMDALQAAGLIDPSTRVRLLSNALVCVVEAHAVWAPRTAAELAAPEMRRLALAQPEIVPAGIYAEQYLAREQVWDLVRDRVVPTENVRAVLAAVEAGDVDAGIVYRTDARTSKRVRVAFEVPEHQGPAISYPVALVAGSRSPRAAREFLAYLQGPAAADRFAAAGFTVLLPAAVPAAP